MSGQLPNGSPRRVLLIGYGNPGRGDDGLGPRLSAELEPLRLAGLTVESDYQLTVEDAKAVADHDVVIFVDAAVSGREPFEWRPVQATAVQPSFSSHSCRPEDVLALAEQLFGAVVEGYVLAIRGYAFDAFDEALSEQAAANLAQAVQFAVGVIESAAFRAAALSDGSAGACASALQAHEMVLQ